MADTMASQGKWIREVYMCDAEGNVFISRCKDKACTKCALPKADYYGEPARYHPSPNSSRSISGYSQPANKPLEQIGCKSDFLKVARVTGCDLDLHLPL